MGCCLQTAQTQPQNSSSSDMKHLNIMQLLSDNVTLSRDECTADQRGGCLDIDLETAKKPCNYNLTDLRSLEGVARLWSKAAPSRPLPFLQCSKSTPMTGNVYTPPANDASPPSISTYFFQHARPPKLKSFQSHSNRNNILSAGPRSKMQICPENTMINHLLDDDAVAVAHQQHAAHGRAKPTSKSLSNLADADGGGGAVTAVSLQLDQATHSATTPGSDCDDELEREFDPFDIALDMPMGMEIELELPQALNMDGDADLEEVGLASIEIDGAGDINCMMTSSAVYKTTDTATTATAATPMSDDPDMLALEALCEQYPQSVLHVEDFVPYPQAVNIGVGASSVVTKAFHLRSCKMMAIKTCRVQQNDKMRAFRHEIELHHELQQHNAHLINMVGFGWNEALNEMFVSLEFMDLNSAASLRLHDTIASMQQRELIVGHVAWNVVCALCAVHERGYVHNDVKPANILVNSYGEVKLSDFDTMLQLRGDGGADDLLHKNNGTQKYQSPEKTIFAVAYNTRSDIWSLGVSCYEMLFGDAACSSDEELSYVLSPPQLDAGTHGLSPECCDFIGQCLTVDFHDRPSASQLLQHAWFTQHIQSVALKLKWPYLSKLNHSGALESYYHEDLLFMINALIQYYGSRQVTMSCLKRESVPVIRSNTADSSNNSNSNTLYTDEERITNMAKHAFCSKKAVMERIRVTVAYIRAHLNKMENTRRV